MHFAPWVEDVVCLSCGTTSSGDSRRCPDCGGPVHFETVADDPIDPETGDEHGFWRFSPALPIPPPETDRVNVGETPIVDSRWLAEELQVDRVTVKDESRNPTGSQFDREMHLIATMAAANEIERIALPSPGRSGIAAAAAAAHAGRRAVVYVPARAPFPAKAMINVHGGTMEVVRGKYPDARTRFLEIDSDRDWWSAAPGTAPERLAARKTIFFEFFERLDWSVPDVVILSTGTGLSAVALHHALETLTETGYLDSAPRIILAQPAGCAPLARSWEAGNTSVSEWDAPDTICGDLEFAEPPYAQPAIAAVEQTDGDVVAVEDEPALAAMVDLSRNSGLQPSLAMGYAAVAAGMVEGLGTDAHVGLLNPGTGLLEADLLRSHLMSRGI